MFSSWDFISIFFSRVVKMQSLIFEQNKPWAFTGRHSPLTGCEITPYMMQHICNSRLQETYYTLTGRWVDIEERQRLWSWNARCLDLQRWRETITFVRTVSIATFLPLSLSFYFLFFCVEWGGYKKPLCAPSCNNSRHLLSPDDAWTETERGRKADSVHLKPR